MVTEPACAGGGEEGPGGAAGRTAESICSSFSSTGLAWEKPAHSGTFPAHSAVCKKPCSRPPSVSPRGDGNEEGGEEAGCGRNAQDGPGRCWVPFLPKVLEAAEKALSRLLQIGVALALALWRACQTLSLPCSSKERPQLPGLLAWEADGPRSETDYHWPPVPA